MRKLYNIQEGEEKKFHACGMDYSLHLVLKYLDRRSCFLFVLIFLISVLNYKVPTYKKPVDLQKQLT